MKIQHLMALVVLSLPTVPGARAAIREFKVRTLVSGLLALACLLVAVPATAQVNYAISGGTAYVADSPGASGDIVIASTYNGYPVTYIKGYAFYECAGLTRMTIPDSVTVLGEWAFWHCTSLTNVTIPNSVTSIGSGSFADCPSLKNVTIPNSVTSIENAAFAGCGLTNVTIPNSVTIIGSLAFLVCGSLTSVTIPNSVTIIGEYAFYGCASLTNATIGNGVTSIGHLAFQGCSSLTSVTIGNSVTSIGMSAFYGCTSLTNMTIPNSVTNIGHQAFSGCTSLMNLSADAANPAYSSLTGVLFDKAQTTSIAFPPGRGGSYVIPNSVTDIGNASLSGCTSLTRVTIPNSVSRIGFEAFMNCTKVTNFTFLGNAPVLVPYPTNSNGRWFVSVGAGAKAYYYCGTTGWGTNYGGLPTVMLCAPQMAPGSAGMKPGGFGFTLTFLTNQTIVVEASANLVNWQPIWTNTPPGASTNFVDPEWRNHSNRFYRARSD